MHGLHCTGAKMEKLFTLTQESGVCALAIVVALPAALVVFVGGGLGATLRWAVTLLAGAPMATWMVNIVGSFGLAWLTARGFSSETSRLLLGTGLMGGFTTYSTFNQEYWNTHSVVLPRLLAQQAEPGEVHTLPVESFHWPSWDDEGIAALFEEDHTYPDAYVHHLWAGKTWETHLSAMSPASIYERGSSYNRLARRFVDKPSD